MGQDAEVEFAEQLQDIGRNWAAEFGEGVVQRLGACCGVADEFGFATGAGDVFEPHLVVLAFVGLEGDGESARDVFVVVPVVDRVPWNDDEIVGSQAEFFICQQRFAWRG